METTTQEYNQLDGKQRKADYRGRFIRGSKKTMTVAQLRKKYSSFPVRCVNGEGDLPCLEIKTDLAEARVYLYGAHVTHFQPHGQKPVLFMSEKALFQEGKPIRGGVPVCFPWFGPREGDAASPIHGLVRLQTWEVTSIRFAKDGAVDIVLRLGPTEFSNKVWPVQFSVEYHIHVGLELKLMLRTTNTDSKPFTIQEALHTYLAVGDVRNVSVSGLENAAYYDKVDGMQRKTQNSPTLAFTGETDRLYINTTTDCTLRDPVLGRQIIVSKQGSESTVIWNPWIAKSAAMADFGDDEWPSMLCIETVNAADNSVTIQPGQTHEMQARIRVE